MVLTVLVLVISFQPKMSSSCWKSLRIRPSPDHLNKTVDHHLTYPWTSLTTLSQEILTFTWLLHDLHMTTWQSSDNHLTFTWTWLDLPLSLNWHLTDNLTIILLSPYITLGVWAHKSCLVGGLRFELRDDPELDNAVYVTLSVWH